MKNIPMFTTESGVASLVLEEIPYKKCAYIRLQSASDPAKLLEDAVGLCCSAGAIAVYATGNAHLIKYPLYTEILEMTCCRSDLTGESRMLVSVDKNNIEEWIQLYNRYMEDIPNAATMTSANAKKLLETKDGYFVYADGMRIGAGKASGDKIDVIISLVPGRGSEVLRALCSVLKSDLVRIEVASTNTRAIRLYQKNGFLKSGVLSQWYKVM